MAEKKTKSNDGLFDSLMGWLFGGHTDVASLPPDDRQRYEASVVRQSPLPKIDPSSVPVGAAYAYNAPRGHERYHGDGVYVVKRSPDGRNYYEEPRDPGNPGFTPGDPVYDANGNLVTYGYRRLIEPEPPSPDSTKRKRLSDVPFGGMIIPPIIP
jgi:hypothetical protein